MRKQWPSANKTLAANLDRLMKAEKMSDRAAQQKCGVGHKTINNMRHAKHAPELDNVEKVAKIFGLQAWMLLIPDVNPEVFRQRAIHDLVDHYVASTDDGKKTISAVAASAPKNQHQPQQSESLSA